MLKQRLLTSLVLGVLTVSVVLWLPSMPLATLLLVVMLIAGWEWARLVGLSRSIARMTFVLVLGIGTGALWYISTIQQLRWAVMVTAGLWWLMVLVVLAVSQPTSPVSRIRRGAGRYGLWIAAGFTLIPAWLALFMLHEIRPELLLFLLLIVWGADGMAFFAGKAFGRTKLAPALSPGKTREGLWGALAATLVIGTIGALWWELPALVAVYFTGLCLVTALFSVVGDLFESLLKRQAGVKDSGSLLPGHGGVLDRIDSLAAAAPIFVLGLYWINWPEYLSS
ncbi:MAG: phosphatidate cytidylyltransferase [Gammaproteobacteria bacterium]|nr:phosphatidate cytidylyltransferase [Gammaproteobacteria bacterium]